MALPAKKCPKSAKGGRWLHIRINPLNLVKCKFCGRKKLPHRICKFCGSYKESSKELKEELK